MGLSAHLHRLPWTYLWRVRRTTGTTMDAIIRWLRGGARTRYAYSENNIPGGVISPCSSRGRWPDPAATRGGSLQAWTSQSTGSKARCAERENGPAAPAGGSVRDKEKP